MPHSCVILIRTLVPEYCELRNNGSTEETGRREHMSGFGFKEINIDNWLLPNNVMGIFATLTPTGEIVTLTGEDWLERMLEPKLDGTVPEEVQALFEVARGALVYGYLFYPLHT